MKHNLSISYFWSTGNGSDKKIHLFLYHFLKSKKLFHDSYVFLETTLTKNGPLGCVTILHRCLQPFIQNYIEIWKYTTSFYEIVLRSWWKFIFQSTLNPVLDMETIFCLFFHL